MSAIRDRLAAGLTTGGWSFALCLLVVFAPGAPGTQDTFGPPAQPASFPQPARPAAGSGGAQVPVPVARVEHFVLLLEELRAGGVTRRRRVGRALVRRVVADGRTLHELEVTFEDHESRAHFVERDGPSGRFVVARELMPRGGRSVTLQALGEHAWRRNSWGRHGVQRREEPRRLSDVGFPGLIEHARGGGVDGQQVALFDLLSDSWLSVRLVEATGQIRPDRTGPDRTARGSAEDPGYAFGPLRSDTAPRAPRRPRRVEARLGNGELAGWFEFQAKELVAFGWQDGGLVAERVGRDDWEHGPIEAASESE